MSNETVQRIKELIDTHNFREIGEKLGLTRSRVQQIAKKHGMNRAGKTVKLKGRVVECVQCGTTFLVKTTSRTLCSKCKWGK